jgi:hypothetical protein
MLSFILPFSFYIFSFFYNLSLLHAVRYSRFFLNLFSLSYSDFFFPFLLFRFCGLWFSGFSGFILLIDFFPDGVSYFSICCLCFVIPLIGYWCKCRLDFLLAIRYVREIHLPSVDWRGTNLLLVYDLSSPVYKTYRERKRLHKKK